MKSLLIFTLFALTLFSCSVVKSPQSSNFQRVKYNAHLKKNKKAPKAFVNSVQSLLEKKEVTVDNSSSITAQAETKKTLDKKSTEPIAINPSNFLNNVEAKKPLIAQQLNYILNDSKKLLPRENKAIRLNHDWWDEDPEDWPWGEIVLAVIAILVIAILIVILIELVGAIIGSLLGLIFLLALAYFLYQYWI